MVVTDPPGEVEHDSRAVGERSGCDSEQSFRGYIEPKLADREHCHPTHTDIKAGREATIPEFVMNGWNKFKSMPELRILFMSMELINKIGVDRQIAVSVNPLKRR